MKIFVSLFIVLISASSAFAADENDFTKSIICRGIANYLHVRNYEAKDLVYCRMYGHFSVSRGVHHFTGQVKQVSPTLKCEVTLDDSGLAKTPRAIVSGCEQVSEY
jgi:hypothetical protein